MWIAQCVDTVKNDADGLHGPKRADPAGHSPQHTVFGARVAIFGIEGIADKAAITGMVWQVSGKSTHLSLKTSDRCTDQRYLGCDTGIRYGEARGKVVAPIQHQRCACNGGRGIARLDSGGHSLAGNRIVKPCKPRGGALGLSLPDIGGGIDCLALEVRYIDAVIVNQCQLSDTGRSEVLQGGRSDPAQPDQNDMRIGERYLTCTAHFGKYDMPGKTLDPVRRNGHAA